MGEEMVKLLQQEAQCVDDSELGQVCSLGGAYSCGLFGRNPKGAKKCKAAAGVLLGEVQQKVKRGAWSDKPPGCSMKGTRLFFNSKANGSKNEKHRLICFKK